MSVLRKEAAGVLRQQAIDQSGPGTILRDFESLLEFIGPDGVRSTGKYHLLPIARLFELDARMARPLRPDLKRPQQRSFPHLGGLYLLLRATRLAVPKGTGKESGRLVLDPQVLGLWRALNSTEQYFNLLEAWLFHARPEMLGEGRHGFSEPMFPTVRSLWDSMGKKGRRVSKNDPRLSLYLYGQLGYCNLALMELFGLADVERGEPVQGQNWPILSVRRTPFGEAILDTVNAFEQKHFTYGEDVPAFGRWQPLFQKTFPEWVNNLAMPEPEFRDGVYYFKAKLGSPWRVIAIPGDRDLDELAAWIIDAFDFGGDHLYAFTFPERDGTVVSVEHPYVEDASEHTDKYSIGYLPLEEGESMEFEYDFGASWRFDVKLERVEPPNRRMKKPRIVESHGTAPKEYDDEDDDDEEDDDFDDAEDDAD